MTATDELRRMLDERGVWHEDDEDVTRFFGPDGFEVVMQEDIDGKLDCLTPLYLTPEQAIAATLGREDTYTREDVESAFVSGYSLGCLPAGSDPTWDQNEQTIDEYMAEWGWVREESATQGDADATRERQGDAGTCKDEGDPGDFCCSECGMRMFTDTNDTYTMIASDERTIIKHPNFCPNCGRKVVDE